MSEKLQQDHFKVEVKEQQENCNPGNMKKDGSNTVIRISLEDLSPMECYY